MIVSSFYLNVSISKTTDNSEFIIKIARSAFFSLNTLKRFYASYIAGFLILIFTFLSGLLFIIPGVMIWISYSMTFYIIADNPSISGYEAIKKSQKMIYGYKYKYFCLLCRFIGWVLLSILTFGIGFLWLIPYIRVSSAKFYEELKLVNH